MKFLILIFLSPVLFSPCFAEERRYRLQGSDFAKWQMGWVLVDEELKGYVDSKAHPGYGFSDTAVKDGQIIIKTGAGNLVFSRGIRTGKDIIGEPKAFQATKGKVIMFNYASERASWSDVAKMYEETLTPDSFEAEERGIKFYPLPLSYFSQAGGGNAFAEALMGGDGDGPGNGGGSPSAGMKFYFSGEATSLEQLQQIKQRLEEEGGAFVMTPFYGPVLEEEAALFGGKKILAEDVFVNHWGMMPNEERQNELLKRLMEQAGLAEEFDEGGRDVFAAYDLNETPDVDFGFIFEVPESYLREKTGMAAYDDYNKGVQFMIGIPQNSFNEKARAIYEGYGDMGEKWHQNSMEGMGDFSIQFFK